MNARITTDLSAIKVALVEVPANERFRRSDLVLETSRIELLITSIIVHGK